MLPYSTIGEQNLAPVAQLAERCSYEAAAEGSSPSGSIGFLILDFPKDIVAEWSKATDSSSVIFGCAGSNPAGVTKRAPIAQLVRAFDCYPFIGMKSRGRWFEPSWERNNFSWHIINLICQQSPIAQLVRAFDCYPCIGMKSRGRRFEPCWGSIN